MINISLRTICTCLVFLSLTGCNEKKATPADTIAMLQQMEELSTVEYTISKVIKASDNKTWFKAGERKILMTSEASIKAGINMQSLTEKDISISGKTITVHLPTPTIQSVNLPPEKIKVAFEKVGMFRDPFTVKERNDLLVQAEQQIRNSTEALGILAQAKVNTQVILSRLLLQLGFTKVLLTYDKPLNKQ